MTRQDVEAIEKAIIAGIEKAIDKVLVNPFPKPTPGSTPDYKAVFVHAKSEIETSVRNQLSKIRTT